MKSENIQIADNQLEISLEVVVHSCPEPLELPSELDKFKGKDGYYSMTVSIDKYEYTYNYDIRFKDYLGLVYQVCSCCLSANDEECDYGHIYLERIYIDLSTGNISVDLGS